jgi:hypothetical protein
MTLAHGREIDREVVEATVKSKQLVAVAEGILVDLRAKQHDLESLIENLTRLTQETSGDEPDA